MGEYYPTTFALSIFTSFTGLSLAPFFTLAMASTTSMPSITFPKTGCLLSRKLLSTRLMKNWLPPVFGSALAVLEWCSDRSCSCGKARP